MPKEIIIALIAAFAALAGSIVTLIVGLRNIRIGKERLGAEISKLQAEANKIAEETNQIRRQRLEAERAEVRDLLVLFDKAVFDAPMHSEDPSEMFHALQRIRLSLQMNGASLVRDRVIAENFREVRKLLLETENEVLAKYPIIERLSYDMSDKDNKWERRERVREALGRDYYEPVRMMMDIREDIAVRIGTISRRFHELFSEGD